MTCIVGIADGQSVWLGGDSAGSNGWTIGERADVKVFVKDNMIMGFCGSYRMGQLLRYKLRIPPHQPGQDVMEYMVADFIEAVRQCFRQGGFGGADRDGETGGLFLLGYRGVLYCIDSDHQVGIPVPQFEAVGSGAEVAIGSLASSTGPAPARLEQALNASSKFTPFVAPPYTILQGGFVHA